MEITYSVLSGFQNRIVILHGFHLSVQSQILGPFQQILRKFIESIGDNVNCQHSLLCTRCWSHAQKDAKGNLELMKFQVDNECKRLLIANNVKEMGKIKTLQTTENV